MTKQYSFYLFLLYFISGLFCQNLEAELANNLIQEIFADGITVDLREPVFCDGALSTEKGGIITGSDIRIQAVKIVYTRKQTEGQSVLKVEAEEDLMIEFGAYVFVGKRLEYDFLTKSGTLFIGRTTFEPWYVGGCSIQLCSDGSYIIHGGFLTTSESRDVDWQIVTQEASLRQNRYLEAKNVTFRIFQIPVFWLPWLKVDFDWIFDHPIRYEVRWGGREGPRLSMLYEIFSWGRWKNFLRLEYRLKRGPGGGFETTYSSEDRKTYCETINYVARDSSLSNPHEKVRYRFQGIGGTLISDDTISIDYTYDKISDIDMPTDYSDRGLEFDIAGRTAIDVRRQTRDWIAELTARVRINNFQTVKQELPTFRNSWRSFQIGSTGIISENQFTASYLDFAYADHVSHIHDYSAPRIAFSNKLYRSINSGPVTILPEVGTVGIIYGNSPKGDWKWLTLGLFSCEVNSQWYRFYGNQKHVLTPYVRYSYYTFPTVSPHNHYIFDIEDGWYRLNMMRLGVNQSLYIDDHGQIRRYLYADLWANTFFNTKTQPNYVPRIYADLVWNPFSVLRHTLSSAWNTRRNQLDYFNFRTEWSVNTNFAISTEYRHRSSFDWRKADHTNFILDSFRSWNSLQHSSESDRRDTALLHFFYRFLPNWALEVETRHGWNRKHEPQYTEYEIDFLGTLRGAANVKFSYQHRQGDHRLAVYFSIGLRRPDKPVDSIIPFLEF